MTEPIPGEDLIDDFTSYIPHDLMSKSPVAQGSFGDVYHCTFTKSNVGKMEVAVKVFRDDHRRSKETLIKAVCRELNVWCGLRHPNIVPLLGIAQVEPPFPALVSLWMISGTLFEYLKEHTTTISPPVRGDLIEGIAKGLNYLHRKNIIHGDFHPGNILIDDSGSPRIADFGLATVAEDPELQWGSTTAERPLNSRWRAPEVLGINDDPRRPTFESDIYSFGSVMFFIVSGDIPWKEKKTHTQIIIELSKEVTHTSPQNVLDNHWHLIQYCWSREPKNRPTSSDTLRIISFGDREWTKNIVVFGETGAGKSSVINLMAGQEVAKTSPGIMMERCTLHWKEHLISFDQHWYKVFDTAGIEEPQLGMKGYLQIVENAYNLVTKLQKEGGINLLLLCVRAGRVTTTLQITYRLFYEWLCAKNVPVLLVLTGLEREHCMEDWWVRNAPTFDKYDIKVNGHACITAAKLDGRHMDLYVKSQVLVRELVIYHTSGEQNASFGGEIFHGFIRSLKELIRGNRPPKEKDVETILIKRCKMDPADARQLASNIGRIDEVRN